VNLKLGEASDEASLSFGCGVTLTLEEAGETWNLEVAGTKILLPADFSPTVFHQYCILCAGGQTRVFVDGHPVATAPTVAPCRRVEVIVRHATAVLDMVRFTLLTA
jgi:hypothetical protein